jgi:hypothetical protein
VAIAVRLFAEPLAEQAVQPRQHLERLGDAAGQVDDGRC